MTARHRPLVLLLCTAALVFHALVVARAWHGAHRDKTGRDFASYYYAVQVAADGGDPYTTGQLGSAAREDATRKGVHPFFYPPPFVLGMAWALPLELRTAYRVWFWLNELTCLLAAILLWRWWRPLGSSVAPTLALLLAAMTAIPNNHLMGQANFPVLALVVAGLAATDRKRPLVGGALMGVACMMKMSPGLLVAWWLLHRRWRAAAAACVTAVLLSVASLSLVGFADQLRFFTEVLPGFGSGTYNGLSVGIDLFGNHSLPNIFDGLMPHASGKHRVLSAGAHLVSTSMFLGTIVGLGLAFRGRDADGVTRAGQIGAVLVAMLILPVFTYEHHLVMAIPAVVAVVLGVEHGRLDRRWWGVVAGAAAVFCYDLAELKVMFFYVKDTSWLLGVGIREAKFASLVVLLGACVVVGRGKDG